MSLNINVRGMGESATLGIQERCRVLRRDGVKVFNFGLGQSPFPVPATVVETLKVHAHEKDYLPVRGLPELREAVAAFHGRIDHVSASPDLVLVGPGSKELMFLLQIAFYGELVLPSPCWVSYVPQARILGKQVRILKTRFEDRWHVKPEMLDRLLCAEHDDNRPRILVLNYPGNPDGLTYAESELAEIAEVARKYRAVILSDEIYGQINHRGAHVSVARFHPDGTIISSGISKWCGAGGWRLGTMTFPRGLEWLLEAMSFVASETYTSVSAPIQYAAVAAFRGGAQIERYLRNSRRVLAALGGRCSSLLADAGVRLHPPEGGFYLFLDFEPFRARLASMGVTGGADLCERLLREASAAVLPGCVFERPEEELTVRLSYVNFDGARALAASEEIPPHEPLPGDFLERFCGETVRGAENISAWARNLKG